MREYYARFFKEVWRQVLVFWQAQVGVSLGAGIITAIVSASRQETALTLALWSVGAVAIGYLAMLGMFSIFAVMCAPVTLDRQRAAEFNATASALREGQALIEGLQAKHPQDQKKESEVAMRLQAFSVAEIDILRWLLDHGETRDIGLPFEKGMDLVWAAIGKGLSDSPRLLSSREVNTPGGNYKMIQITPGYIDALRAVLYPRGPVTPPQA